MSPHGCPKMSAKLCNRNAEESFPVLSLKSWEQKPPNPLLIQDKNVLQPIFELYSYAPGPAEALPRHTHEAHQFCLSVDFPGEYYYRGTSYPVPPSSLSVIHPGEMHAARDLEDRQRSTTFRVVYVSPAVLHTVAAEVAGGATSLPFFATPIMVDASLAALFLRFHVAWEAAVPRLEADALLLHLLTQCIRRYADTRPARMALGREHKRVQRVREYLQEHY